MVHPLSLATTYIETFYIRADNGQTELRSYATGFFVRDAEHLLLVTNWHVLSGLDPANPAAIVKPPPNYVKISLCAKDRRLNELTVPLYDRHMKPLWREHRQGFSVDVVVYPLPLGLAQYFEIVDIRDAANDMAIEEVVAKDVFVLGYPFGRQEMKSSFGDDALHFLPVWKRGTIAWEPSARLGNYVILIDTLSRPGMSGAPVLISDDREVTRLGRSNAEVFRAYEQGTSSALDSLSRLDVTQMVGGIEKSFRLLGVYSGVIGNTRLEQVALGKCWHVDVLSEMITNSQPGKMPYHGPPPNEFYDRFLSGLGKGQLTRKNAQGETTEKVPLS